MFGQHPLALQHKDHIPNLCELCEDNSFVETKIHLDPSRSPETITPADIKADPVSVRHQMTDLELPNLLLWAP
jgi:hypothetical protein